MPQVPIQTSPTVDLSGAGLPAVQGGRATPVMQDVAGQQAQQMGAALQQASKAMMDIQDRVDETEAKAADVEFTKSMTDGMWADGGFFRQQGKAPSQSYQTTLDDLVSQRDVVANQLNGNAKKMFLQAANVRVAAVNESMMKHASQEYDKYESSVLTSSVTTSMQQALLTTGSPAFDQNMMRGETDARALAEQKGEDPDGAVLAFKSSVYAGIALKLSNDGKHIEAKQSLDEHWNAGHILAADYLRLGKALQDGYDKDMGEKIATTVSASAGQPMVDKAAVYAAVRGFEGSAINPSDGGRGKSLYGITQDTLSEILPGKRVETLTEADVEKVYNRFWKDAGIDNLPDNMKAVAFSTALNMGVGGFKKLYAQSGNDPVKFMQLREQKYRSLGGPNLEGWLNRMRKEQETFYGEVTMEGQVEQAKTMAENETQANIASAQLISDFTTQKAIKNADSDRTYELALQAQQRGEKVPTSVWIKLTESQRSTIMNPLVQSDKRIVDVLEARPDLWNAEGLRAFRPNLTVFDYRKYLAKGGDQKAVSEQTLNNTVTSDLLVKAGMGSWLKAKEGSEKANELIEIRADATRMITASAQARGKDLTLPEKETIVKSLITPVMVRTAQKSYFGLGPTVYGSKEVRFFEVLHPGNVIIPEKERRKIESLLRSSGMRVNTANVVNIWLEQLMNR